MARQFTEEEQQIIADIATSHGDAEIMLRAKFDLEGEELIELLLDNGIEQCPCCDWFAESGELTNPETSEIDGHCDNCRPNPEAV